MNKNDSRCGFFLPDQNMGGFMIDINIFQEFIYR